MSATRGPGGRFGSGGPGGPGRPRRAPRDERTLTVYETLRAAANAHRDADPEVTLAHVLGGAELLLRRVREVMAAPAGEDPEPEVQPVSAREEVA